MAYAQFMRLLTYILLVTLAATAHADIYRSVDENGNVIYSDTPSEGAEKIEVKEAQTLESQPGTESFEYEPPETEPAPRYEKVTIASPQNDASIRSNNGDISIRMSVAPSLKSGDRLVLRMDGKEIASGQSTSVSLKNVDRGTHTLQASVVGSDGQTWVTSDPVKFHLLRHSIQHSRIPAGPLNPPGGPVR